MPNKTWKQKYEDRKPKLLANKKICKENKDLFTKFFEFEEKKLTRSNDLRELDEGTYKTLYGYITKFEYVNKWFNNKPWKKLTKKNIENVYNDLEDGKIKRKAGIPYKNLKTSYYNKIFKSKPFELAGKLQLAQEVIQYGGKGNKEVRFITEQDFRKLISNAYKPHHRLLLWLSFDIGENINSLLKLKKSDFYKQQNPHTKEPEYRVNLREEILKRSRRPRSEITNFNETTELLDQHLRNLKDNDLLFNFDYRNAKIMIDRLVNRAGIKCTPGGEKPTWKDIRNAMACDLLKKGWSCDEVNSRLGHRPSSDEIDKYISFLALDRHTPKKKMQQYEMQKLNEELQEVKRREKLQVMRNEEISEQVKALEQQMEKQQGQMTSMKEDIIKSIAADLRKQLKISA